MNIVLGYQSAIECWQAYGQAESLAALRPTQGILVPFDCQAEELADYIKQHPAAIMPLHILVPDASKRKRTKRLVCHICTEPLPRGSLWAIEHSRLVTSPELTYLHMAKHLPFVKLIELGMELCGTYQPSRKSEDGINQRDESLTTPEKLRRYVARMKHERGSRQALAALDWVQHGSASPMETFLWMRLCLPVRLGGRGFQPALLNFPIELDTKGRTATRKETLRCDLYYPEHRVAIEYDSTARHTGGDRIASDSIRRGALECQGIKVVTITQQEFFTFSEFEGKVRQIAKFTGKRLRTPNNEQMRRRQELRDTLLSPDLMRYRIEEGS